MKVFVTGGAGYIGSATSALLLAAGHDVIVYDNLSRGHRAAVPKEAEFVQGDLLDRAALDTAFARYKPDGVFHFAALIEAGESMQKPGLYLHNNLTGAIHLLESMIEHGVKKLVFSSTAAVYASKNGPLNEDDPYGPSNLYGDTKLMIERMLAWYHQIHGLAYCALRYFNAGGAMLDADGKALLGEAHQPESHLIPLTLQVPLGLRDSLDLFGTDYPTPDGTCIRDYIHIHDLASAHVLALDALASLEGELVFNLGNGRGYSNREVIEVARKVTGHAIPVVETDRRAGDTAVLVASAEKINHELGWVPRYPDLMDIIASAWAWHQSHPNGYASDEGKA